MVNGIDRCTAGSNLSVDNSGNVTVLEDSNWQSKEFYTYPWASGSKLTSELFRHFPGAQ